jgi:hypothetical protein
MADSKQCTSDRTYHGHLDMVADQYFADLQNEREAHDETRRILRWACDFIRAAVEMLVQADLMADWHRKNLEAIQEQNDLLTDQLGDYLRAEQDVVSSSERPSLPC